MVQFSGMWMMTEGTLRALLAPRHPCASSSGVWPASVDGEFRRSVEVAVPPTELWPWLTQVFRGAGTFGWPVLETPSRRSADYLLPGLPEPRVGDSWGRWLELVQLDPLRSLCWRLRDECSVLGFTESGLTIEYSLSDAGQGASRLESRVCTPARHLTGPVAEHLKSTVDVLLPAHQLARLRHLAETYPSRQAAGQTNRGRVREHQVPGFVPGAPPPA